MEKINTEMIICSLFVIGFDRVDSLFFTYVLGKLLNDNMELKKFQFEEKEFSENFNKYIEQVNSVFQLKKGYSLDSKVSVMPFQNVELPLIKVLKTNDVLIEYLKELDYKDIVVKKIISLGIDRKNEYEMLFSEKEKEIISNLIKNDNTEKDIDMKQVEKYDSLTKVEDKSFDRTINYLDNLIKSQEKEQCKIIKFRRNLWN